MTSPPEDIPKLDLYNFEESRYANCDYVLTSPRSLEACSRHDIMPTDLLSKSLVEFNDELREYDLQPSTIFFLYSEQETERQMNLKKCQEERSRIIKSELERFKRPKIETENLKECQEERSRIIKSELERFKRPKIETGKILHKNHPRKLSNIRDISYKTEDYRRI